MDETDKDKKSNKTDWPEAVIVVAICATIVALVWIFRTT